MKDYIEKDNLFEWPQRSIASTRGYRKTDPPTSKKAYRNSQIRHGSQQHQLLQEYHKIALEQEFPTLGLTDEEAGVRTGLFRKPKCCYWKRCSELRQMLLIRPNGEQRRSSANEAQIVCIITEKGQQALKKILLTKR